MAWIESHTVLLRHRKVVELARGLRLKPVHCLGHLHVLWHAALEQREDGDLSEWSEDFIAENAAYAGDAPKFVSLLELHGWLDGRLLHDWLDYAGRYLMSKYASKDREKLVSIWAKHGRVYGESKVSEGQVKGNSPPVGKGRSEREKKEKEEIPKTDIWDEGPGEGARAPPDNETPYGLAWNYRAAKAHGLIVGKEDEPALIARFEGMIASGIAAPVILAEIRRKGRQTQEAVWEFEKRLKPVANDKPKTEREKLRERARGNDG